MVLHQLDYPLLEIAQSYPRWARDPVAQRLQIRYHQKDEEENKTMSIDLKAVVLPIQIHIYACD